jgi:hypothetical protein
MTMTRAPSGPRSPSNRRLARGGPHPCRRLLARWTVNLRFDRAALTTGRRSRRRQRYLTHQFRAGMHRLSRPQTNAAGNDRPRAWSARRASSIA